LWHYLANFSFNRPGLVVADLVGDGVGRHQVANLLGLLLGHHVAGFQGGVAAGLLGYLGLDIVAHLKIRL